MIVLLCATPAAATAFSLLQLSTMQRNGSYHSLNVHNIYRENVKTKLSLHVVGRCEKHLACSSFMQGEEYMRCMCGGRQWSLDHDAVNYLT